MDRVRVRLDGKEELVEPGTPVAEVLARLDPEGAERAVAARLNGRIVDLSRGLTEDAVVAPVLPEDPEGVEVLRHSSAHLMAQAVKRLFPETQVTIGPVTEDGFYYDFKRDEPFTPEDLEKIEETMRAIVRENLPVRREEVAKEEAIELFRRMGEHYKVEILEGIPDPVVSLYRQGEFVDLCRGPHVPSTGKMGAFKLTSVAGAYWRGDERNEMLQRIYGTAFPTAEELRRHLELLEEARRRDHRKLGKELDLFSFDPIAPGSPFFHPKGAFVYNALVDFMRRLNDRYGFQEVVTPQIFDSELWRRSGHYDHYRENMYFAYVEGREFGIKPMNCPSHCLLYALRRRSYRELPVRYADFGRLHRAERSGTLHGLTRVRSFTQDDAHIFCTPEQIRGEILSLLRMVEEMSRRFGFAERRVCLSTRPEDSLGDPEMWERAETALREALEEAGVAFEVSPGEGAFYGPKIDFHFFDALHRPWQLSTIQLDFGALPERFDLTYVGASGSLERPVMIHRAILGTVERFFGIFLEHCGGAFPLWLAPEQVRILTLTERQQEFGRRLAERLRGEGWRVTLDDRNEKLGWKVREAQLEKVPYMLVVGDREAASETVSVRSRERGNEGVVPVAEFLRRLREEAERFPD
ncbi:MAG: threonine--tRNA ligase [Candidatus Binatia bacterium]|nr:MAG: threonine--tRNA ligase [Candidatus Binatia bacterium]